MYSRAPTFSGCSLDLDFHKSPEAPEPKILSVSELTRRVERTARARHRRRLGRGEISNYRRQSSGHQRFHPQATLQSASAACSSAARRRSLHGLKLADGQRVQVFESLSFTSRGASIS